MGGACSMHVTGEKCIEKFSRAEKPERKIDLRILGWMVGQY
jgi:hypothetical protein